MIIRSIKSFNAALETLRAGEVDAFGASDHKEISAALRRYRDRCSGRFSELTAYIVEAEEQGMEAMLRNRAKLIAELTLQARRESNERRAACGY